MRIESATLSCSGLRSWRPLRNVPFVDPMSSMYMKSPREKILAWADDANGSSIWRSAVGERPSVIPSFTSTLSPGSRPSAATTSSWGNTPLRRSIERGRAVGPVSSASAVAWPPETSRKPLRAIHRRNSHRTARKPNLSMIAIGSSMGSPPAAVRRCAPYTASRNERNAAHLFDLEVEFLEPHRDLVAGLEPMLGHAPAVHLHAVRRGEVRHHPGLALLAQLGVAARHVRVVERKVGVAAAADHE